MTAAVTIDRRQIDLRRRRGGSLYVMALRRENQQIKGGRTRRPRLTTRERARRAARIVAARHQGATWAQLAGEFELSVSQVREIVADWQDSGPDDVEGTDALEALVSVLRQAVRDFAVIAQCATHDSNRIGALKGLIEAAMLRYEVERAAGLTPHHPAAPVVAHQVQAVFREFAELLRAHQVGDDVLRDFLNLAERAMGDYTERPALMIGAAA